MDIGALYNKDIESIREKEFPNLRGETYVEHVGTTLYAKSQMEAFQQDLLGNIYGNPHSNSPSSYLATDVVDQVRCRILHHFKTSHEDYSVVFTSGCTGALKLLAETFKFDPSFHSNQNGCTSCNHDNPESKTGVFVYLLDNHTSVQGMRETMATRAGAIYCLDNVDLGQEIDLENKRKSQIFKSKQYKPGGNNIFAFPAESNFSGTKYSLDWVSRVHHHQFGFQKHLPGRWFTVLDAAAFVSTSDLDLGKFKPDFVTLSFYKMFGFPTGIGALLVRNQSAHVLEKRYFGGGTVEASTAQEDFRVFRKGISDRFEDGTVPFLNIIALRHGFDALDRIGGGIQTISQHAFAIARYFYDNLSSICHDNGQPLAEIYCEDGSFDDIQTQGPIVNFNLRRANGDYIGFAEVDKMAALHNVHLRTGCFCNIGACQKYLHISSQQVQENHQAGHSCGDSNDLIEGHPTGSVRVSFGYSSIIRDAQICLNFITACFQETNGEKINFLTISVREYCHRHRHYKPLSEMSPIKLADDHLHSNHQHSDSSSEEEFTDCQSEDVLEKKVIHTGSDQSEDVLEKKVIHTGSDQSEDVSEKKLIHTGSDQSEAQLLSPLEWAHILGRFDDNTRSLVSIMLYPIKSCGAMEVFEWDMGERGLSYDRDWMVVSESGVVLSQKRETNLCLLRPTVDVIEQMLRLDFPDMETFYLPLDSNTQRPYVDVTTSKVCGDRVSGVDCGDDVADWISVALQRSGCRLIQQNKQDRRTSKLKDAMQARPECASSLSLANESQYLLISQQSVQKLKDKIVERQMEEQHSLVDSQDTDISNLIGRFRGNLVVSGGEAFEEDSWETIEIGDNKFQSQGRCGRCQMICVDQSTGQRDLEPLRSLASWRDRKMFFGIHVRLLDVSPDRRLRVGDRIHVAVQE